ncbi:DUF4381 domain-containing protein [Candidatus Albibeggiatoa sp. nov. BB20]|uniref:DUF4381 domain-containing protein n=1 Tax=Candidatus Albibeggiatoa sp. nov. BB20 TaxID=3162723 RepID=UPI0033656611
MNPELRDIHGLDTISWYPLPLGWWLVILAALLAIVLLSRFWFSRKKRKKANLWRKTAKLEWQAINKPTLSSYEQANRIASLLRWIAMQQYGREACASLNGDDWLDWLQNHDPKQFDWQQRGHVLVKLPYMPPETEIDSVQLRQLHQAIYAWI